MLGFSRGALRAFASGLFCLAVLCGLAQTEATEGSPTQRAMILTRGAESLVLDTSFKLVKYLGDGAIVEASQSDLERLSGMDVDIRILPDPRFVPLHIGEIDLTTSPSIAPRPDRASSETRSIAALVAFDTPQSREEMQAFQRSGVTVLGSIPPYAYLVQADRKTLLDLKRSDAILAVASVQPEWKKSPNLAPAFAAASSAASSPARSSSTSSGSGNGAGTVGDGDASEVDPQPARVGVRIASYSGGDLARLEADLQQASMPYSTGSLNGRSLIMLAGTQAQIDTVAAHPDVEWIEADSAPQLWNEKIRVLMQTERQAHNGNTGFFNPVYGIGVYGESQRVAVADTGTVDTHELFLNNLDPADNLLVPNASCALPGDTDGHGSAVAGVILGDKIGATTNGYGNPNDFDGLALRAQLISQDMHSGTYMNPICPPTDFTNDIFREAFDRGARVHNNSWGHGISPGYGQPASAYTAGTYSLRSEAIDSYLAEPQYREEVIVFAAGNAGANWDNFGNTKYTHSLSDEAHAKNSIAVGGTYNGDSRHVLYRYSSTGPPNDCGNPSCQGDLGRIKPDLVAPAINVTSADLGGPSAYYEEWSGTSFSAPAISAAAALVRDYFDQELYPNSPDDPPLEADPTTSNGVREPSSALIKAMLVNASVFMSDDSGYRDDTNDGVIDYFYPNYVQGFGRPALENVLEPAGYKELKVFEDDETTVGEMDTWQKWVLIKDKWQSDCNQLRITLAWTDPPKSMLTTDVLVHDLDLEVRYQGVDYFGNSNTAVTAVDPRDRYNNVEDIVINLGEANWNGNVRPRIRVIGHKVDMSATQDFSVVMTYGSCFDNTPCAGIYGCYGGPGDIVPGSNPPPPSCQKQDYSTDECIDCGEDGQPQCVPPPCSGICPGPIRPVINQVEELEVGQVSLIGQ